jgi:hypothetical protein
MATKEKVVVAGEKPRRKRLEVEYVMDQYRLAHPDVDPAVEPHLIAEWAIKAGISRPVPETPMSGKWT